MNPFFSIIIPTYNSASTIQKSLQSIITQSFRDYEVVVMDGKSKDDTCNIVKGYQSRYSNIHIYSEVDQGIYDAMNKGIALAKGQFLFFMGSDDFFYDTEVLKSVHDQCIGYDVVYGNVYSPRFKGVYDGTFDYAKLERKNICHQAIFFSRTVFDTIGTFRLKYKSHADWDHNIRWFFSSKITKKYMDLIVANYADGGFSSLNPDITFKKDKQLLLFVKGFGKFPLIHLLKLLYRYFKY